MYVISLCEPNTNIYICIVLTILMSLYICLWCVNDAWSIDVFIIQYWSLPVTDGNWLIALLLKFMMI